VILKATFISLVSAISLVAVFAAGEVDTSFNASIVTNYSVVPKVLVLSDGKILAGGFFRVANGTARTSIARFNADGSLDPSFNPPDFFYLNGDSPVIWDFELQSNGKIIVTGDFFGINGVFHYRVLRLNADGSYDNSFFVNALPFGDFEIYPDDSIAVASSDRIVFLNPNGTVDTTRGMFFGTTVGGLLLQPDGKLLVTTGTSVNTSVKRFNSNGTPDTSFANLSFNNYVYALERQPDGKILIGGQFTTVNGFGFSKLARFNENGTIDGTFYANNDLGNQSIYAIAVAANGKIAISGNFGFYQGVAKNRVALLNSDGTLDVNFNPPTNPAQAIEDVAFQTNEKLLVGGWAVGLVRLNIDGSTDVTFLGKTAGEGYGYEILIQPDGKIIVGGNYSFANNTPRNYLARFNADGSLDASFNTAGLPVFAVTSLDIQPDGKILIVAGGSSADRSMRLNTDGSLDLTFQSTSDAFDVKVLPSGKILVSGSTYIRRFNSDGSPDGIFATTTGSVYKMFLQADGKILIGGSFSQVNSVNRGNFARLNADGTVDTSFNPPGGANGAVYEIASQANGKVVVGGAFTGTNFDTNHKYLARLNADGTLDNTFNTVINAAVDNFKIQSNGKILVGASLTFMNLSERKGVIRLNPNGVLDSSFNVGIGSNGTISDIELQADGKIVFCGKMSQTNGIPTIGVGRLLNTISPPTTLFDYDGDGRADVSVYRPSTNRWYVFKSSDSTVSEATFGLAGDVVSPADYDGDGKTDLGIFRSSSGDWWYQSSINGAQISVHWGANGDIPRPGDFDQDGKADYIVFRPSNNVWYRFGSTGATSITPFGLAGDKPVSGDFDGDGKSDLAIFRPSTGDWWYQSSINGAQLAVHWGISTDIPAPADYDGDGKTDFAVYRPSTGVWYVINSSNGSFLIMAFGIAEDKPVPADYDGDGKADIAVFRPSTGTWYQMNTTAGFSAQQFGVSTDIPTENAFVP
jgi:uncharacterized delta-60 repeat protein